MDIAVVDHLLTTTRSVRKRLDLTRPVEPGVIERCLEIAMQAPTGSNSQGWHFLAVTDPEKKRGLASLYRKAFEAYAPVREAEIRAQYPPDDPRTKQMPRIVDSAIYLLDHMHEVPMLLVPTIEGRVESGPVVAQASLYGSILPAVWSFMLAGRARGLGSAWTSLHLVHEREAAEILGIPENVTQTALLPVAYFEGSDFKPAKRLPARERIYWNGWGNRRS